MQREQFAVPREIHVVHPVDAEAREELAAVKFRARRQVRIVRVADQQFATALAPQHARAQFPPAAELPPEIEPDFLVADAVGREALVFIDEVEVAPLDLVTFLSIPVALTAIVLLACLIPARKAARSFSLSPPIAKTRPRKEISPVMAISL